MAPPVYSLSEPPPNQVTDLSRWRLKVGDGNHGRHQWVYLESDEQVKKWPQTTEDKYWLGLETDAPDLPRATTPLDAARNGYEFYKLIQSHDGHWAGEYGGPMFLIPGCVIGTYVMGHNPYNEYEKVELIRYLKNRADPDLGGWGIHTHSPPTVFGTALTYTSLRILGVPKDEPFMLKAHKRLHEMGGTKTIPSWGKVWLSLMGCYEWNGVVSLFPELWYLPEWLPVHPWRWWIHNRNVYTPMAWLYGNRYVMKPTPLVYELRAELYTEPYESISWIPQQSNISSFDIYSPHHPVFQAISYLLIVYEIILPYLPPLQYLRRLALAKIYNYVTMEDEDTDFGTVGPVSKMFNWVVRWAKEGDKSGAVQRHKETLSDFYWMGREGLMMTGTNGSQLWDAAFIAQALTETGLADEPQNRESVLKLLDWLDKCQIQENPKHYPQDYRHSSKGAWPFSTPSQSYTVSDCTAEGLKAVMGIQELSYAPHPVLPPRLKDSVDLLLSLENRSGEGGFASYELVRGSKRLEWLNAAEVFGNIMIEYAYPECTTSALSGLKVFSEKFPEYRKDDIDGCISRSIDYIHSSQRSDGSWFGSWGICFTYAMNFAIESLTLAGETYSNSQSVKRACEFLLAKQMDDGGWGETYMSCVTGEYAQHESSQVVQTAWALLTLINARYPNPEPIKRAINLIMSRQNSDGSWTQEDIEGIFNKNCAIVYPNFKFSFTIWSLGKASAYLKELEMLSSGDVLQSLHPAPKRVPQKKGGGVMGLLMAGLAVGTGLAVVSKWFA